MSQSKLADYESSGAEQSKELTPAAAKEEYANLLSLRSIAEKYDVTQNTVEKMLDEAGVELRGRGEAKTLRARRRPARLVTNTHTGYENVEGLTDRDGKTERAKLHRLMAVAKFGFEAVRGRDVHHKSRVEWDNRMSNIEVMDRGEHIAMHKRRESSIDQDLIEEVRRTWEEEYPAQAELANQFDISESAVRDMLLGLNAYDEYGALYEPRTNK